MYTVALTGHERLGYDQYRIQVLFADTDIDLMVLLGGMLKLPVFSDEMFEDEDPIYLNMDEDEFRDYIKDLIADGASASALLKDMLDNIESDFVSDGSFSVTAITIVKGTKEIFAAF